MSYDLYLFSREGASNRTTLTREAFFDYFEGEHYTTEDDAVSYNNGDTGVYFSFTWYDSSAGEVEPPKVPLPHVHFKINYNRSHVFALEAERELTALVEHFDLLVEDPQDEGMSRGEYTADGFLRGWNAGNGAAHRVFAQMESQGERGLSGSLTLPSATLRACWEWSRRRDPLADELFDDEDIDVFVPRVMFLRHEGRALSFCVWPNLIPSALPQVDRIVLSRNELPEPWASHSTEGLVLIDWEQLRAVLLGFDEVEERDGAGEAAPLPYLLMTYARGEDAPEELARYVIGLPGVEGKLQWAAPGEVLDEELVRQARADRSASDVPAEGQP
jgi:hypothetical protein